MTAFLVRKNILCLILLSISVGVFSSCNTYRNLFSGKETRRLFPIWQNGKAGYINRQGEVVVQPQFDSVLAFSEGLAVACTEPKKCGYIDETGKYIINPQYIEANRFSEGLASVYADNKIGYIDQSGKYVINPQFEETGSNLAFINSTFSEGLALVKTGEKYGYIDKTGKYIINPQFEDAKPFFGGLAAVKIGSKWGYVNPEGKIVINPQYGDAQPFVNNLAAVLIENQYGFINQKGEIVINPQFDFALPFSDDGLTKVVLNHKVGIIDKQGKYVINPQFAYLVYLVPTIIEREFRSTSDLGKPSFSEGLTPVSFSDNNDSTEYIDVTGKIVINPQFSSGTSFHDGLAFVTTGTFDGSVSSYIDKDGNSVWREVKKVNKPITNVNNPPNTNANNSNMANEAAIAARDAARAANDAAANANAARVVDTAPSSPNSVTSKQTGRLTTDSNLRSDANKNAASLGIQFKGASVTILEQTSFPSDNGETSTWFKIHVTEYGCSVNTNLGCGKNTPGDADDGWVNAKNVLLN